MWWWLLACTASDPDPAASDTEPSQSAATSTESEETDAEAWQPIAWEGCTSAYEVGSADGMDDPMVMVPTVVDELAYFGAFGRDERNRVLGATVEDGQLVEPWVAFESPDPIQNPATPMLLEEADGSWSLYLGGSRGAERGTWRCLSDDGRNWDGCQLVIPTGYHGTYDTEASILPHVLWMEDHYRLWYTGMDGKGVWRILTSTSDDGWDWSPPELAVPLESEGSWDDSSTYSPFVWKDGDLYRLMYAGRALHKKYLAKRLIEAWSTDGVTWQDFTPSLDLGCAGDADAWRLDSPWVVPEGDGWRLYYDGFDDPITTEGRRTLLTATSAP